MQKKRKCSNYKQFLPGALFLLFTESCINFLLDDPDRRC